MLSLRHLTIFKAVSEAGSFTRAAQTLYLTQSAVSHAIRELEVQTGTVLFDRLSKRVQPTAAGKLLLEEAAPILASCDALEKRIGSLEMYAPIHIVSSITIASFWLPRILQEFGARMAGVPVYVQVVSAAQAIGVLRGGGADLAFVEGVRPQGPFLSARLADYSLKIVCAPVYPLESRKLSVAAFCAQKLLLREPGSAIRDTMDSALFLLGHTARPLWESVNSTALVQAAKAGLGLTVLPEVLVREALSQGELVPLEVEGLSMKNGLFAVWHKDKHPTPALEALLSCTRAEELSTGKVCL